MFQPIKIFYTKDILRHLITMGFMLFFLSAHIQTAESGELSGNDTGTIVVTIKPLYSLVAHLTDGVTIPVLLMKQAQSPHHYNMRPSERRLLSNAQMIVWLGPQMESYLSKIIQQQNTAAVVTALHANDLNLFNKRKQHSHDDHGATSKTRDDMIDPHIWLSTQNAKAISSHITDALITHDPINAQKYKNNLQLLLQKIDSTKAFINSTLKANKQPFIAFHDAFQYFEEENGLNYIDSITFDDETGTSLKRLRQIMKQIEKNNIQCLVYQNPKPALIDSLIKQTSIKATALDPLGLNIKNDKNAWFKIMQQLAVNFSLCLDS